jgi:hypothetical protein
LCTAGALLWNAWPVAAQLQVQPLREAPPEIPYQQWAEQGPIEQIDWKVRISKPYLSIVQRQLVEVEAAVNGKALWKGCRGRELWLLLAVRTAEGEWLPGRDVVGVRLDEPPAKADDLVFENQVLMLPGKYTLAVVLFDRQSGQRSVTLRTLNVPALRGDPLPEMTRHLPRVEFLHSSEHKDPPPRQARQTATSQRRESSIYQPDFRPVIPRDVPARGIGPVDEMQGRLWLPLETKRPLEVDIVVNFSPSEVYAGRGDFHRKNMAIMLGMMHVLSQIHLSNGRINLTAVDLAARSVIFEQKDAAALDWDRLRGALTAMNPHTVRARDLSQRRQNAAFFREFLARKLAERPQPLEILRGNGAPSAAPLRVVIVVTSLVQLARGSDLAPLAPPARDVHFYYFRYQISLGNVFDDFGRIFQQLEPHRFHMDSPMAFRRALARMLASLRTL